jgi:hypothetical protein
MKSFSSSIIHPQICGDEFELKSSHYLKLDEIIGILNATTTPELLMRLQKI